MHDIDTSTGRAAIAFVGATPWHGLGQKLDEDADIDTWRIQAGMDWKLISSPVQFTNAQGAIGTMADRRVLLRDDTQVPLAVVSDNYKVVQPGEVLDFYDSLVKGAGFKLHTAGVLAGGRKYWALAETGLETRIKGQDQIAGFLLLATACDGTLATRAMFTSVRVVCANTLGIAVDASDRSDASSHIRVPHSAKFDADKVKAQLGIVEGRWETFTEEVNALAERKVSRKDAVEWLVKVFGDASKPVEEQENAKARTMQQVMTLFEGHGRGSDLRSADGTAWGLVNAVTEFVDHHRGRSASTRLEAAWFGDGASTKRKAWNSALALAA